MNILFINRMMGTAWGGGENYDYNLAAGLREMGHEVLFVSGRLPGTPEQRRVGDLEMVSLETPYLRRFMYQLAGKIRIVPGLFAELDRHLFQRRAHDLLRRLIPQRSIDLIQILGMPQLAEYLSRLGLPVVMRFPGPPAWFLANLLRRFDRRSHTAMFAHGDAVEHVRRRLGVGIHDIPPGIARIYRPAADRGERDALRRCVTA